jgi:two-component system chemotaxis sensor kinase CheA
MRRFKIVTTSSDNDLLDLFTFHVAREHMQLAPLDAGYGFSTSAPARRRKKCRPTSATASSTTPPAPERSVCRRRA